MTDDPQERERDTDLSDGECEEVGKRQSANTPSSTR